MRPVVDPGPTCDDGIDHDWKPPTQETIRMFREPVVFVCGRCGRAVGPKHVGNIRKALKNRVNRNDRLATFFESIGEELVDAAQALADGDSTTAAKSLNSAGLVLKQGASVLRGDE